MEQALLRGGVEAFPGSVRWVRHLRESRGAHRRRVLERERATRCSTPPASSDLFDAHRRRKRRRRGSASPASPLLTASSRRHAGSASRPARAVVVEDALAGVAAGTRGRLRARRSASPARPIPRDLRSAGADVVVDDLGELPPPSSNHGRSSERPLNLAPEPVATSRCSRSATATSACAARPRRARPRTTPATILNGFHETWPIVYPEDAYGLARTGQTIVNATDGSIIRLFVDDEPLNLATSKVHRFERVLDMKTGILQTRGRVRDRARSSGCSCARHGSRLRAPPPRRHVLRGRRRSTGACGSRSPPSS